MTGGEREVAAERSPEGGEVGDVAAGAAEAGAELDREGERGFVPGVTNPTWRTMGLLWTRLGRRGSI